MEEGSGDLLSRWFAVMAAVSGHRAIVSRSPEQDETLRGAFAGLLQQLIVATVLLAAAP